ncbi:sulfatase-like hydrolase/transferase [Fulvivirgaceae bacterium BMA10]|uniref:Sulfatase-like hydrolase/transferase n=1 Tax=Splendidivirga corallicola TaxID=3051826 RepID=A0ABT8KG98_9BACT|nr:sulfatase-like hydrolase/transferase [Fulvivirgaceae bacterium BMA10]
MVTKKFFRYFQIFAFVSFLAFTACSEQQETTKEPNVLLIVVDDQGYADIGSAKLANDVSTPNIDKLANSGVRFTQAYASSPICSPSRGGIITGCYQQRWGTFWYGGPGLHDQQFRTIAELLKDNNYTTGYIGKVHYGSKDHQPDHRSFPLNHGFDYFFGHTSARKHYLNHDQSLEDDFQKVKKENNKSGQSLRQQALWENFDKVDTIAFSTELFADKAMEFIKKHSKEKFFLQLSFNAVHNFTHQLPESYLKEHNLNGYHDWDPAKEDYYEWYKAGRKPNNPEGREHYLGQLYYLDKAIGDVLNSLKTLNLDENTLVVFISDNGGSTPIYANNYPLRGSKYLLYEGGIRVPMIVSFPGEFKKAEISDNIVSGMDILPTICSVTGINTPEYIDGFDLSELLTGENESLQHDTLIWDTGHETAVRAGNWKLRTAKNDGHAQYEMVALEMGEFLYDLEKDPGEQNNLITEFPEIAQSLKDVHRTWKENLTNKEE